MQKEKEYYEIQHLESFHYGDLVVADPSMKKVLALIDKVAKTESTVLISGETGVGREVVARIIHRLSNRNKQPFISVNCGALSEKLITSELFGHEKGAFTGAIDRHIGRFELADGGTLFLDEIGEISQDVQVQLLRVLETRKFERVGGKRKIHSDFRLIVATNKNLEREVQKGRFRSDLYYRLNVFPIYVPRLRERKDDILPLADYFINIHSQKMDKQFEGISREEVDNFLAYDWPGNVRELENVIERSVILSSDTVFTAAQLLHTHSNPNSNPTPQQVTIATTEKQLILGTLKKTNWKLYGPDGAADILGINRSTLYYRMKKHGIKKKRERHH